MTSYPRILILAPIPYPGRPLGGVVVLVQNFLDFLRTGQYPFIHISTNHYAGRFAGPGNLLCLLIGLLVNIRRCDIVMFNCSSRSAFAMYPFFTFLALFFRKKVVFRMFAGAFYEVYTRQPKFLRRCFVKALRRSTLIFGEIAATTHYLRKLSGKENVHQFPNVRIPIPEEPIAQYEKKCAFISRISHMKGVDIILQAMDILYKEGYSVDFYGNVEEEKYTPEHFAEHHCCFRGVLPPEKVASTLTNYNLLLLPTLFTTEGHPGIIIEAMSAGVPVIASSQGGIPELVRDKINGFLIPPDDVEALIHAMRTVTPEIWKQMSQQMLQIFDSEYNSVNVNLRIYQNICRSCGFQPPPATPESQVHSRSRFSSQFQEKNI